MNDKQRKAMFAGKQTNHNKVQTPLYHNSTKSGLTKEQVGLGSKKNGDKTYIFTGKIFINAKSTNEAWDNFQNFLNEYPLDDEFEIQTKQ